MKNITNHLTKSVFVLVLLVLFCFSCDTKTNDTEKSKPKAEKPKVQLRTLDESSENVLYSYMDEKGSYHTVEKSEDVPDAFRNDVVVVDLTLSPEERSSADTVVVADLERRDEKGGFLLRTEKRATFDQAMKLKRKWKLNETPQAMASVDPAKVKDYQIQDNPDKVILYATSWCGYCKAARAWLKSHGVAYEEKDIEKNDNAAIELQAKMAKAGLQAGGVPVIDWKGKIIPGFDKAVLAKLLQQEKGPK